MIVVKTLMRVLDHKLPTHKPELHSSQKYRPHPCWPLRDPSERLNALG